MFEDLGLSMSAAITLFLKNAVNSNSIPFEIKRYTPASEAEDSFAEL